MRFTAAHGTGEGCGERSMARKLLATQRSGLTSAAQFMESLGLRLLETCPVGSI